MPLPKTTMITPDTAPANPDASSESTEQFHVVPLATLAVEGATPEIGDTVEFTVKGRLAKTEGGEAYVTPETINGHDATLPAEAPGSEDEPDMMAMAKKADAETDESY